MDPGSWILGPTSHPLYEGSTERRASERTRGLWRLQSEFRVWGGRFMKVERPLDSKILRLPTLFLL